MNEKMQLILENDELMMGLVSAKTPEELNAVLARQGFELEGISADEAFEMVQDKIARAESGELSEEELEAVSGGWYNIAGIALQAALTSGWASVVLPAAGVLVAFGVAKHLIGKAAKKR